MKNFLIFLTEQEVGGNCHYHRPEVHERISPLIILKKEENWGIHIRTNKPFA